MKSNYKQVGICGEHGGEPSSVAFFAEAGLDYVSCSPFRFAYYLTKSRKFMQLFELVLLQSCIV